MSPVKYNVISEDVIKFVFSPLRDTLEQSVNSMRDSNLELKLLNGMLTTQPNKDDLNHAISILLDTVRTELSNKTKMLEVAITTKYDQNTRIIIERLDIIQPNVVQSNVNLNKISSQLSILEESVGKLISKMDMVIFVISIAFALSMVAWGVVSYFFSNPPGPPPPGMPGGS